MVMKVNGLAYPSIKADIDLCYKQLHEICQGKHGCAIMSVPPQPTDFDMQMSAAFDELKAYRATGLTPEEIPHWIPVSEPPKKEQWCHVAVKTKNGYRVENDLFAVETADHFGHEHGFCKRDVAYWMPLPKAPKEAPNA